MQISDIDDLLQDEESGAGHLGTVEFNSATLYRYATVNAAPSWLPISLNIFRISCFHACEEILALIAPPYLAVLGLPVSSRLMQLGGTFCNTFFQYSAGKCSGPVGHGGMQR